MSDEFTAQPCSRRRSPSYLLPTPPRRTGAFDYTSLRDVLRTGLIFLAIASAAIASASVRDDIQRQYSRWAKAALTNDVDTILSVLAPDYTLHTYTGTAITREKYEASLRKRKAENKPATVYQTSMASCTTDRSVSKVISDETSVTSSMDPITNKKMKLIHIHRYLDTWVKLGSAWRLQSTVTTVESTKVVPE